jgi:hypothetical protein
MPAHRKWSDAQRAAMYSLWEQGIGAAEIARRCRAGFASVSPFEIPRRTVHAICTAIERERAAPRNLDEAAIAVAQGRHQERVFAMLEDEVVRLEAKQRSGPLTVTDLERVEKVVGISASLERRLRRRKAWAESHDRDGDAADAQKPSPLEELAARMSAEDGGAAKGPTRAEKAPQAAPSTAEERNGAAAHDETEGDPEGEPEDAGAGFSHARKCPERSDTGDDADTAERAASESTAASRENNLGPRRPKT